MFGKGRTFPAGVKSGRPGAVDGVDLVDEQLALSIVVGAAQIADRRENCLDILSIAFLHATVYGSGTCESV